MQHEPKSEERHELTMLASTCGSCGLGFARHRFVRFATVVARSADDRSLRDFCRAFKGHEWKSLCGFQVFDPLANAAIVYAIDCPRDAVEMIFVRDPFEFFDAATVEERITVSGTEAIDIRSVVNEWTSF